MKKSLIHLTIVVVATTGIYLMGANNKGKALDYYDACIDRINCTTDDDCYNKDTICDEITEALFYGKIDDKTAERMIVHNVETEEVR